MLISSSLAVPDVMPIAIINDAAVLALTMGLTSFASGLYQPRACLTPRHLVAKVVVAGLLSALMILVASKILRINIAGIFGRSLIWPIEIMVAWTGLVFATRLVFSWAIRMDMFVRRVAVIGSPEQAARTMAAINSVQHGFSRVAATIPVKGATDLSLEFLRREKVSDVIVGPDAADGISSAEVAMYQADRIRIWGGSEFWERRLGRIDIDQQAGQGCSPVADRTTQGRLAIAASRMLDLVLTIALLVLTLPLMLLTALAIKIETPGPVFYRQERVGLHGKVFTLCKFRSMRVDAETSGPTWAAQRDGRVTRVGAIIRRTRIDELPQLLNVLRGEMSFIGPRPERPYFTNQIMKVVPFYGERALVKPGLTGWAQVNFPYGASIEDARVKLSYDLYYVKHRSLLLDFLILFSTVRVILFQEGAR